MAWCGPSLLVAGRGGELGPSDPLAGYFFREARHLSRLALTIDGSPPWICAEAALSQRVLDVSAVYPERTDFGGGGTDTAVDDEPDAPLPLRAIELRWRLVLGPAGLEVELRLENRSPRTQRLVLRWSLAADFADLMEALAGERRQNAEVGVEVVGNGVVLRYGHERVPLATRIEASGADWRWMDDGLSATVEVGAGEARRYGLAVAPEDALEPALDAGPRLAALESWRRSITKLRGAAGPLETVRQAVADLGSLALLTGEPDEWLAVQAGVPLYPALFGRDAVTAGWQAAMFDQGALLAASLARLGRRQARADDPSREAEPGRIPFQMRTGPLVRLGLEPFDLAYGDFASPLMFVVALAQLFAWRGDVAQLRTHWDTARRVLEWARTRGDRDGDGYLEYETRAPGSPKNQGWKDSGRAILYEDGRPVPAPLATCELQGYWYAAQQLGAMLAAVLGDEGEARALWRAAADLKTRFNRDWWLPEEGFVALALDPDKRPARTIASNAGHCLATGILDAEHAPIVVGRLMARDLFSGWGVRTLSTDHPAYHPLGYHLGSVWAVENATIAFGMRRFGFDARALDLCEALFDLADCYELGRIPECVGGYDRSEWPHPGAYPRANPVQAWNLSALPLLLQTMLGLEPLAPFDLLVTDPVLPVWLPEVTLEDLRVGGATATVRFWRDPDGTSHAEMVRCRGTLRLVRQPPPESLTVGLGARLGSLWENVKHH